MDSLLANPTCEIICLQEVTNEFYRALHDQYRSQYSLVRTDLKTNNIVLLSRTPFTSSEVVGLGSPDKQAIIAVIDGDNEAGGG